MCPGTYASGGSSGGGSSSMYSQPGHRFGVEAPTALTAGKTPRAAQRRPHSCCPAGRRFVLGLCSLDGHQLAGEERFCVEMHADGSVL